MPPVIRKAATSIDLNALLDQALAEPNAQAKGALFERFFEELIAREHSVIIIDKQTSGQTGSIDYIIEGDSKIVPFNISPWVAVECKNWSDSIDVDKVDHFIRLVHDSGPLVRLGLMITTSYLEPSAHKSIDHARVSGECTIVPIEGIHLRELIKDGFYKTVKDRCLKSFFRRDQRKKTV